MVFGQESLEATWKTIRQERQRRERKTREKEAKARSLWLGRIASSKYESSHCMLIFGAYH